MSAIWGKQDVEGMGGEGEERKSIKQKYKAKVQSK